MFLQPGSALAWMGSPRAMPLFCLGGAVASLLSVAWRAAWQGCTVHKFLHGGTADVMATPPKSALEVLSLCAIEFDTLGRRS